VLPRRVVAIDLSETGGGHGDLRALAALPLTCLMLALGLGVLAGFKAANPWWAVRSAPMQVVQPLHTFLAVAFVLSGTASLTLLMLERAGPPLPRWVRLGVPALLALFTAAGAGTLLAGWGSGLEYLTWPRGLTAAPVAAVLTLAICATARVRSLVRVSPEGAWLLLIGLYLIPLGLVERVVTSFVSMGYTQRLTTEWHALDATFAGWNAALYGLGVLLVSRPGRGKPLRSTWLFGIAAFALLSTFGHHHYVSPQADMLKMIAVIASMLGGISFVRHARTALRRCEPRLPADPLLRSVERWTLFSLATGILLAVPQVNLMLHGTHAIVGHAMCSMIGVDAMLVLAGFVHASGRDDQGLSKRLAWRARAVSACLILIAISLLAAGLAKGLMRADHPFADTQRVVRWCLAPLPWLGILLTAAFASLAYSALGPPRAGPRGVGPAA
jgi:cbb3-type cytochrome oxidase subunit 1